MNESSGFWTPGIQIAQQHDSSSSTSEYWHLRDAPILVDFVLVSLRSSTQRHCGLPLVYISLSGTPIHYSTCSFSLSCLATCPNSILIRLYVCSKFFLQNNTVCQSNDNEFLPLPRFLNRLFDPFWQLLKTPMYAGYGKFPEKLSRSYPFCY